MNTDYQDPIEAPAPDQEFLACPVCRCLRPFFDGDAYCAGTSTTKHRPLWFDDEDVWARLDDGSLSEGHFEEDGSIRFGLMSNGIGLSIEEDGATRYYGLGL